MICMHVDQSKDSVWVAIHPICLDRCPNLLGQDKLRQIMEVERIRIAMEQLDEQALDRLEVEVWIQVKKVKVDIDVALLVNYLCCCWC